MYFIVLKRQDDIGDFKLATAAETRDVFKEVFGGAGEIIAAKAPGRVNLIGEHTDYNDGFVLPMAISHGVTIVGRLRNDRMVRLRSLDYGESAEFDLDERYDARGPRWSQYVEGVARTFDEEYNGEIRGFEAALTGDVPQGSGLSSSAALEVAAGLLIDELNSLGTGRVEIALFGQKAEHNYLGVKCGIMDQFASCLCRKDHALFLDCRSLEHKHAPLKLREEVVLILDSGKSRGLADSKYNERRAACEEGVRILSGAIPGIRALRDVSEAQFDCYSGMLPDEVKRRCRHVVTENQRALDSMEALLKEDMERFGALMFASHESLRFDYEVSCEELDVLNEIAKDSREIIGERMTGAGFGGCAVALARREGLEDLKAVLSERYFKKTGRRLKIYETSPASGAAIVD